MNPVWMLFVTPSRSSPLFGQLKMDSTMGLLDSHPYLNVPLGAIKRIEELFGQVKEGLDPKELHNELTRWGLFEYYQDRFLNLFRPK